MIRVEDTMSVIGLSGSGSSLSKIARQEILENIATASGSEHRHGLSSGELATGLSTRQHYSA